MAANLDLLPFLDYFFVIMLNSMAIFLVCHFIFVTLGQK